MYMISARYAIARPVLSTKSQAVARIVDRTFSQQTNTI